MKPTTNASIVIMPEQPSNKSLQVIKEWMFDFYTLRQVGLNGLCSKIYEDLRHSLQQDDQNIAIHTLWEVEHVQEVRPDLTQVQAYMVLKTIHKELDAFQVCTWSTLQNYADELFPTGIED